MNVPAKTMAVKPLVVCAMGDALVVRGGGCHAVICARSLPAEWAESSDPYVVVEYGRKHHKTKCDEGKSCWR